MTATYLVVNTLKTFRFGICAGGVYWILDPTSEQVTSIPDCSKLHVQRVQVLINRLPQQIHALLRRHGYHVVAVRRVSDFRPSIRLETPKGYRKGCTYDHVPGCFFGAERAVVVPEFFKRDSQFVRIKYLDELPRIVYHEVGHALDNSVRVSSSSRFRKAYQNDLKCFPVGLDLLLNYYLQIGNSGPAETFAEIIAIPQFERIFRESAAIAKTVFTEHGLPFPQLRLQSPEDDFIDSANAVALGALRKISSFIGYHGVERDSE